MSVTFVTFVSSSPGCARYKPLYERRNELRVYGRAWLDSAEARFFCVSAGTACSCIVTSNVFFVPRDAMLSALLAIAGDRLCPSHSCIVSKSAKVKGKGKASSLLI